MLILICMIVSSSLMFFMFLIQRKLFRNLFSFHLQSIMLKFCFIFLLVPLPQVIVLIRILLFYLFGSEQQNSFIGNQPLIIFTQKDIMVNSSAHRIVLVGVLFALIVCIVALHHILPYMRFLKTVMLSIEEIHDEQIEALFCQKKAALNLTRSIRLYKSTSLQFTFTTGVLKPVIIVPAEIPCQDLELIFMHELTHIKNQDVLFRILCYICITLYCFNPLIYVIAYFYDQTSELACDEAVAQVLNFEEKKRYIQVLLAEVEKGSPPPSHYSRFFNNKLFYRLL